uniref:NIF3-like protein 1 n=1 Tax=Lygus hesperus TaxID=30085 RepID=A0A0A9YGC8_LYGHE
MNIVHVYGRHFAQIRNLIHNSVRYSSQTWKEFSQCRPISSNLKMSGEVEGLSLPEVIEQLEKLADIRSAEGWDNVGLLVEPYTQTRVKSVLLTNDLTENVLEEAVSGRFSMIVSYHPPVFSAMKRITGETWKERIVACCLENRIAVYSPHTSWDAASGGVTDWLAGAFEGHFDPNSVSTIIKPKESPETEKATNGHAPPSSSATPSVPTTVGMGRVLPIATTSPPLTLAKCVELVKRRTGLMHVRLATACGRSADSPVTAIALVPGSGGSLLKTLLESSSTGTSPIDLFVTGEMFHHDILDAVHRGVSVILTNHSDSERGFLKVAAGRLRLGLGERVRIAISSTDRDPLRTV